MLVRKVYMILVLHLLICKQLFLGCPHISDHSTNRDGSLTRLLGLNNELTSQPRKLFATCLSDVIQTVNIDFVDLTLYLVVVVCNVFSVDENLEKRVWQRFNATATAMLILKTRYFCNMSQNYRYITRRSIFKSQDRFLIQR